MFVVKDGKCLEANDFLITDDSFDFIYFEIPY